MPKNDGKTSWTMRHGSRSRDLAGSTSWMQSGFAYYIAPAMIGCTRRGYGACIADALEINGQLRRTQVKRINALQARAIARFVRFMIAANEAENAGFDAQVWRHFYRLYWRRFE